VGCGSRRPAWFGSLDGGDVPVEGFDVGFEQIDSVLARMYAISTRVQDRGDLGKCQAGCRMRNIDVVLFDKTGTLGSHWVTAVSAVDSDSDRLLAVAAAVESDSEHPWPGRSSPPPGNGATFPPLVGSSR
jgi:hypothetical protein